MTGFEDRERAIFLALTSRSLVPIEWLRERGREREVEGRGRFLEQEESRFHGVRAEIMDASRYASIMCLVETGYPRLDSANNRYSLGAATSSILVHIRDLYYSSIRRYKFCPRLPPASLSIQSTLPRTTTALCSLHSRRETSANDKNGSIYYFVLSLSILEEILRHPSPYREGAIK